MISFAEMTYFTLKQKSCIPIWRLVKNVGELFTGRNEKVKLSRSRTGLHKQSAKVLCRDSSPLKENGFFLGGSRHFSTSSSVWSSQRKSNQDSEKRKNYILFSSIFASALVVFYMTRVMEFHQDYVYIEPSEDEKTK